jgi:ketosteroid isomerase-like protein
VKQYTAFAAALIALSSNRPAGAQAQRASRGDSASVTKQLDSMYARMTDGYRHTDARSVAGLYAENAFYLPPSGPILRGRDAVAREFTKILGPIAVREANGRPITFDFVDRAVSGDVAYDIGRYRYGGEVPTGKFIVLWRRGADGRWRIWADQYNPLSTTQAAGGSDAAPVSADAGSRRVAPADPSSVGEFVATYRAVFPAQFANRDITITVDASKLSLRGLSSAPIALEAIAADEFRLNDSGGPALTIHFQRTGGRVVAAIVAPSTPQATGPTLFFMRQ